MTSFEERRRNASGPVIVSMRNRAALPHEAQAQRSAAAAPCQAAESALIVT